VKARFTSLITFGLVSATMTPLFAQESRVQTRPAAIPAASRQPQVIDTSTDSILLVADRLLPQADLTAALRQAIARNPEIAIAEAQSAEYLGARREVRSGRFPTVDMTLTANRSLARDFSNDPDNVLERTRGVGRVDATVSVNQTLFDFGATRLRMAAADERIVSALAQEERAVNAVALRALGSWYDYFAFSHMTSLAQSLMDSRQNLSSVLEERIAKGVSAEVDRARLNSALATSALRQAQFQRERDKASAQYREAFGAPPPAFLRRAPVPLIEVQSRDLLLKRAAESPSVRASDAEARSAASLARAARAETLPTVSTGLDLGRYGLFVSGRTDYDLRARITVRHRFFGPGAGRKDQAEARASAATARADFARQEAIREAETSLSDVISLRNTLDAYRADYMASRVTRDAVVIRFRVYRGSLFDVLDAEDRLFSAASGYIRALSDYDAASFILLSRTGQLMESLDLSAPIVSNSGARVPQ
jgi:outer membrane protein, adhesin transport system